LFVSDSAIYIFKGLWIFTFLLSVTPVYQIHVKMMEPATMIQLTSIDVLAHMVSRWVLNGKEKVYRNLSFSLESFKFYLASFH